MTCKDGTQSFGPTPVWSIKSTSTWLFFPMSAPLDSTTVKRIRASVQLAQSTGCKARAAIRMSNDGNSWEAPVAV